MGAMTFVQMLNAVLDPAGTLSAAAKGIGISPQYLHDLKEGRRLPSVEVVNKICQWMGRGPEGRLEWHLAGAAAHGWEVNRSQKSAPNAEKATRK
jgi:transcriptional regulator with XRE-family HTH domain